MWLYLTAVTDVQQSTILPTILTIKKLNYKIWHLEVFFSVLIDTDPIYEMTLTNQYNN